MKKIFFVLLISILCIAIWYGESRKFESFSNGKVITVWRTYNNKCYVISGKYYGLLGPSLDHAYIETTNTSLGVDLIWKDGSDTILAQVDRGSIFHNNPSATIQIVDYDLNKMHNDKEYTYFDSKLHVNRYRNNIYIVAITIDKMGAL